MVLFTRKIEIAAAPQTVWAIMQDVERWHEWTATIIRIQKMNSAGFNAGGKLMIEQPNLSIAVWKIAEMEPQKSFTFVKGNAFLKTVLGHVLQPTVKGTSVTLSIVFSGLLAKWVGRKYADMMNAYLVTESTGLKWISEDRERALSMYGTYDSNYVA
jgi:carbon monoxide dehydrogenase subunit G